ncbi:hypothetical protein AYO37_00610 [Opitutia bacterium SCGC AG-212-L18]|nr:hypothetical protein AYO37_00610 [Opitutae bacterium SCGC AG-212-L18]
MLKFIKKSKKDKVQSKSNVFNDANIKTIAYHLAEKEMEKTLSKIQIPAEPPSNESRLFSKICQERDFDSQWMHYWIKACCLPHLYQRKFWEFAYICHALFELDLLKPGKSGIGFGCGQEPLPSVFAKFGVSVLASDAPDSLAVSKGWALSDQHSDSLKKVQKPSVCPDLQLLNNIKFEGIDMNDIPEKFNGHFDFCWSSCCLEHLGSIDKGLEFILNSIKTLKKGGIAVHTTEYNLDPDSDTLEYGGTVLYQKKHFVAFQKKLMDVGYTLDPIDFSSGDGFLDNYIDIPPYPNDAHLPWEHRVLKAHLRLALDRYATTSIGLIIKPLDK